MIAQDIRDEFEHFRENAAAHGTGVAMLIALGLPEEEIDLIFEDIIERTEMMRDHLPENTIPSVAWIDGFVIGVALERRKIAL